MEEKAISGKSAVYMDETVFDGQSEQGVELDYVLPDYYPDIFKILSCTLTPRIVSCNVSGDLKLNLEAIVYIKALYLTDNSSDVHCIDQRYTYSKLIDIGKNLSDVTVDSSALRLNIIPKSDYCNCRAVSPRRLDIRGAVSCGIRAAAPVHHDLFSVCSSAESTEPSTVHPLEVRTQEISCCGKTLSAEKQLTVREEIDTGAAGIGFILESNAIPRVTDLRIVADKAVLKGTITVTALYGLPGENGSGCGKTEKMTADIPISAILDIEGISDNYLTMPGITIMNIELLPRTDSGMISAELSVNCTLRAVSRETVCIASDAYSVDYETDITSSRLRVCTEPRTLSRTLSVKSALAYNDGEIHSVWDCCGEIKNPVCRPNTEGALVLTGTLCLSAYGTNSEDIPFYIEKQEPLEQIIEADNITPDSFADFTAAVTDTGFSIQGSEGIDITVTIEFNGVVENILPIEAITSVKLLEDKPKKKNTDYALRICYTGENEAAGVWDIAKRYNTTVKALMEDNGIEDSSQPLSGMIIIPTV